MQPTHQNSEIEQALEAFTQAIDSWDPDTAPGVEGMLGALRDLHLKFDPRKDRASAAMCMTSMKLLESLQAAGTVGFADAIGAIGELSHGLRETLSQNARAAARPTPRDSMLMLGGSGSKPAASGLSLAIGGVREQTLDEVMVNMRMLTREQADHVLAVQQEGENTERPFGEIAVELGYASELTVESALRLQSRARGEVPEQRDAGDAWGNSPL